MMINVCKKALWGLLSYFKTDLINPRQIMGWFFSREVRDKFIFSKSFARLFLMETKDRIF